MPFFRLSDKLEFPPAFLARSDGLLCIGGDLSFKRLILAYENGIFPWYSETKPILWWSPNPRLVLFPEEIKISKSLSKAIRKKQYTLTMDTAFEKTIRNCALPRNNGDSGTWLIEEMIDAYIKMHEKGFAHSIETWRDGLLVGGLYGVNLGGCFFGESMFSAESNGSKIALTGLAAFMHSNNFDLIDCQVTSHHLISMGAREISRNRFLDIIGKSVKKEDLNNCWDTRNFKAWQEREK